MDNNYVSKEVDRIITNLRKQEYELRGDLQLVLDMRQVIESVVQTSNQNVELMQRKEKELSVLKNELKKKEEVENASKRSL